MVVVVGCGSPAWRATRAQNTAEAYEDFARNHRDASQAELSWRLAEQQRWAVAVETDTTQGWLTYVRTHGDSARADKAQQALDDAAFRDATLQEDPSELARYLSLLPDGRRVDEVRGMLDDAYWRDAGQEDTSVSYQRYLLQMPHGRHAQTATKLLDDRSFDRARQQDTLFGYHHYLDRFEEGAHVDTARARIEALAFRRVRVGVALSTSWLTDRSHSIKQLASEVKRNVVPRLQALDFEVVGPVLTADMGEGGDPRALFPLEADAATLVLHVVESKGEPFQPSGHGTRIEMTIYAFVAPREAALAKWGVEGATPTSVFGVTAGTLYDSAAAMVAFEAAGSLTQLRDLHSDRQ